MSVLIGQQNAETLLARAVAAGRIGHAYLFLGPPGSGKSTAAFLFAQAINCARQPAALKADGGVPIADHKSNGSDPASHFAPSGAWVLAPCGECESCRRIAAGTHPEVIVIRPGSKTGQDIDINQAREVRRNASLRPKVGTRRIYLVPNAEALNEHSSNALLKTLEEPPDFLTILLCAPSPSLVLPTIRSRCQTVRFGLADPHELAKELVERGVDAGRAGALARASGGRPGVALVWAEDSSVLERRGKVLDVFALALAAQQKARKEPGIGILSFRLGAELQALAGKDAADDEGPARPAKALHSDNLEVGLTYLRDLLLLAGGAEPVLVHNQDRISQLVELARHTDSGRVLDDISTVREAQQLLDRNVGASLVFERMFWAIIGGRIPVRERLFEEAYA